MNISFTKLFSSILESTIWAEADHVRLVWITMLAMSDRKGQVASSIPGLANRARVSIDQVQDALGILRKPDKFSRTPDNEGRRIADLQGGWQILNYQKYRELRDQEAIKESKRKYINRRRAEEKSGSKNVEPSIQDDSTVERSRPKQKQSANAEEQQAFAPHASAPAETQTPYNPDHFRQLRAALEEPTPPQPPRKSIEQQKAEIAAMIANQNAISRSPVSPPSDFSEPAVQG